MTLNDRALGGLLALAYRNTLANGGAIYNATSDDPRICV